MRIGVVIKGKVEVEFEGKVGVEFEDKVEIEFVGKFEVEVISVEFVFVMILLVCKGYISIFFVWFIL